MKSATSKQAKQKISRSGKSEFTRAKLEQQYNPTVRFFKHNLMSSNEIAQKDKHNYIARQQSQICDRAISQVKKGVRITLDWSTRTNFRTTQSILPKVKTEPIQLIQEDFDSFCQKSFGKSIQNKGKQLSRLLFKRNNKFYMLSNREREQQKRLFGRSNNLFTNSRTHEHSAIAQRGSDSQTPVKFLSRSRTQTVQQVQDRILSTSKLRILKQELKNKFYEIRQAFHRKKQNLKHPLAKFFQNSN